jgi:predicted transcriptional regulator
MTAQTTKPPTKSARKSRFKVDENKVKDLVINKGLSQDQAAKLVNCSQSTVSEIISRSKENTEYLLFAEHKDKVFEDIQLRLCKLADDAALKTMLSKRGMTDVGILEDKVRQIRGQATSTSDHEIRVLVQHFNSNNVLDIPISNDINKIDNK